MKNNYEKPMMEIFEINKSMLAVGSEETNEGGCYNGDDADRVICD